jgi:hypothetical protein
MGKRLPKFNAWLKNTAPGDALKKSEYLAKARSRKEKLAKNSLLFSWRALRLGEQKQMAADEHG